MRTASAFAAMNADPAVMEHMQGLMSRERVRRLRRLGSRPTGRSTAGACGRSRCRTSRRSSATSGCGRPTTSPTAWSRSAGAWRRATGATATPRRPPREALRFGFADVGLDEIVSFTVPQNVRSRRVMERIGLVRDPSGDFDHPRVDPVAYPHLVPHVLYRLHARGVARGDGLIRALRYRTNVLSSVVRWACRTTTASSTRTATSASSTAPRIPRS